MRVELDLDREDGEVLARALRLYRALCDKRGDPHRPVLTRLHNAALRAALTDVRSCPGSAVTVKTMNTDMPPFLTQREFGARIGRDERTVRRWIAAGHITSTIAGIPSSELDRLKGPK